jgi:hypothetical protein
MHIPVELLLTCHVIPSKSAIQPDVPGVKVYKDGHAVARSSDFMIYSVEAEFIDRVVAEYGPCKPSVLP